MNEKLIILLSIVAALGLIAVDILFVTKFEDRFSDLERTRIITYNKRESARIANENLEHVRELVFKNIEFSGHVDSVSHETRFFDFITTCVTDLKMVLLSVEPLPPVKKGHITTYPYEMEFMGDFFALGELCAKFENNPRIISIESFKVDLVDGAGASTGKNKRIKVGIVVNTYRLTKI